MPYTSFRIYPYDRFSQSARGLNDGLSSLLIKREGSKYQYRPNHKVINWGCSARPPVLAHASIINKPEKVQLATSKLGTYGRLALAGIPTLEFTREQAIALKWNEIDRIVGRDLDHGSKGQGCHVYDKQTQVGNHKFYTRYFRKHREFRVHVMAGSVIFIQEKMKKKDRGDNFDKYIRSHNAGWCFAFNHLGANPPKVDVLREAIRAVNELELDFGAVDIGWNDKQGVCVFEVNTAPGLEETSLEVYVESFKKYYG